MGVRRLAEHSSVSVFTTSDGAAKTTAYREPPCAPGGEIKLWLSDLVKPEELSDPDSRDVGGRAFMERASLDPFKPNA